jgi:hypothetical protein
MIDNSPAIMTAVGVMGTLTTAYLTGRATFKAALIIDEEERTAGTHEDPMGRFKERFGLVWRLYIPPVTTGLLTVACIIGANRIGGRRAAALAAAYSLSEKGFEEYKAKVVEKMGARKEQATRDELAQDRVSRTPDTVHNVIVTETGSVLCYEMFTGRYFLSDLETIRAAVNEVNKQIIDDSFATLSDFYDRVGLPATSQSDEIGWNMDKLMELHHSATISATGLPCIAIDFTVVPVRHFSRLA